MGFSRVGCGIGILCFDGTHNSLVLLLYVFHQILVILRSIAAGTADQVPDMLLQIFIKCDEVRILRRIDNRLMKGIVFGIAQLVVDDGVFHAYQGSFDFRSEEHTSELQSLMRISYAVFCLKTKILTHNQCIPYISNRYINKK